MSDILSTLAILKEHTWLDLSHEVSPEIRVFPAFSPLVENTLFTVATDGLFANEYTLATQYGTHLDAPVHFSNGKRSLEEIPVDELVLPLYVINKADAVKENPDFTLSVAAIVEFEATNGAISPGSFVAFASGWSERWQNPSRFIIKMSLDKVIPLVGL